MKPLAFLSRRAAAGLLAAVLTSTLPGCGNDKDGDDQPAAGDGTVTWTHSGKTYTSTAYSSAIVDSPTKLIITAGSQDQNNIVSLVLMNLDTNGAGTYELKKGSVLNDYSCAALTLDGTSNAGRMFNTLYAASAVNGSITVTRYDKTAQKLEGTFSYTAGATPNTGATGTQAVTNGTFAFTRFR